MPLTPTQRHALERAIRAAAQALADDEEHHTPRGKRRRLNAATLRLIRSAAHFGEWRWCGTAARLWAAGHFRIIIGSCRDWVRDYAS